MIEKLEIENIKKEIGALYKICGARPSLLINGNFSINQRGNSGEIVNTGYTIVDRWKLIYGTFCIQNHGCRLLANTQIKQGVERFECNNQVLTLSAKANGVLIQGARKISYTPGTAQNFLMFEATELIGELYYDGDNMWAVISSQSNVSLEYAKLEVGESATPYFHKTFEQELCDCQRFYLKIKPSVNYGTFANGSVAYRDGEGKFHCHCLIYLPATMHQTPALQTAGTFHFLCAGTFHTPSTLSGGQGDSQTSYNLDVILPSYTNIALGYSGLLRAANDSNSFIALSAEM